jgi:hypothetical protein
VLQIEKNASCCESFGIWALYCTSSKLRLAYCCTVRCCCCARTHARMHSSWMTDLATLSHLAEHGTSISVYQCHVNHDVVRVKEGTRPTTTTCTHTYSNTYQSDFATTAPVPVYLSTCHLLHCQPPRSIDVCPVPSMIAVL